MIKLTLIPALLGTMIAGCSMQQPPIELMQAHMTARSNFTYVRQDGEWNNGRVYVQHDITKPFKGDCDDWAVSLVKNLGQGAMYFEYIDDQEEGHAVCLYKGWVSDNRRKYPYLRKELPSPRLIIPENQLKTQEK